MTRDEMRKLAYDMEQAYRNFATEEEAMVWVRGRNPNTELNTLEAMWMAIDAYVDEHISRGRL